MQRADIGLIGLAVMGQNLALNLADHGYAVAVYNRTQARTDAFMVESGTSAGITATSSLAELVDSLASPRKVLLMVKAGAPVDSVIAALAPLLDHGDIIIDGGNSRYDDTARRQQEAEASGLLYIGTGVSGGEEGARFGPSIMPGGSPDAWPLVQEMLQAISAKVADGTPCCDWVGPGGAGHFVKMVHNGIEYGDMQVIAEAYDLMKRGLGMAPAAMADVFSVWNEGVLDSFLIEITSEILRKVDSDGSPLVDSILDAAGQKGTGRWTAVAALEAGVPMTLVGEAVDARVLSAMVDARREAADILEGPSPEPGDVDRERFLAGLGDALYASKIVSYAQGFHLMATASVEHGWDLDLGRIASLWREGCIIRAAFLDDITAAFRRDPSLGSLLLDEFFRSAIAGAQEGWRRVVAQAAIWGIPVPAYGSALSFYDGYRSAQLPANLIQAQRDFFGAHTYERIDAPRGEFFHTEWGGDA